MEAWHWRNRNTHSASRLPFEFCFLNWLSKGIHTSIWIGDLQEHMHTREGGEERDKVKRGKSGKKARKRKRYRKEWLVMSLRVTLLQGDDKWLLHLLPQADFFLSYHCRYKNGSWDFSSTATLTYHTKNIYKILSVGLSKMDSTRKQKTRLAIKDCALLGTPHCSPLIHSILVRSGLVFHTTHNVLELISYMGVSTILSFFFPFSNFFIYLRGRKDGRMEEENGRDLEGKRKGKVFSFPINLS